MEVLRYVLGVLDMDGFYIEGRFYCKELGMWRVGDVYAKSYFFDIGVKWGELNEKARRQCRYVIRTCTVYRLGRAGLTIWQKGLLPTGPPLLGAPRFTQF